MEYFWNGVLMMAACVVAFGFAFKSCQNNRFKTSLYLILLGAFLLRAWCAADPFLHEWDERYHALVAKNLVGDPLHPTLYKIYPVETDYRLWTLAKNWVHKPPLTMWLMSVGIWLFGAKAWAARVVSVLASVAAVWLTCRIARFFLKDELGALLAAWLQAVNGLVVEIASGRTATDHADAFFLFFIELAVFCCLRLAETRRGWLAAAGGVALGAAILTKSFPALIVLPVFWIAAVSRLGAKRTVFYSVMITVVALLPYFAWRAYIFHAFPLEAAFEENYNWRHLTETLGGQGGGWFFYLNQARINCNELIYVVFGWFVWFLLKENKRADFWALLVWIVVPYLFFSAAATKMEGYVLFASPAVFILEALFFTSLLGRPFKNWLLTRVVLFAFIILAARYSL